jgi:hypothetical protein
MVYEHNTAGKYILIFFALPIDLSHAVFIFSPFLPAVTKKYIGYFRFFHIGSREMCNLMFFKEKSPIK